MYTYCANNPVIYVDPSGHFALELFAVGLAATAAFSFASAALSQPQVQSDLAKASNALTSGIDSLIDSVASGINDVFTSSGSSQSNGVKKYFTSTCEDPYLAPWIDGSLSLEENWARNWQMADAKAKDDAEAIEKTITFPWLPDSTVTYYHYTNEANAMSIFESGKILPDERGRVFLTPYLYSPDEVNNALFMGRKSDDYGEYRVVVQLQSNDPCLSKFGATQPNEIIYYGTIRNGRNAILTVMKNK